MSILPLAARLVVAAVLGAAGLAKLADREGATKSMGEFGVPEGLARGAAVLLPLAELLTAVLLVPAATAWWGAAAALILFLVFILAIAVNLARGRTPECHCFGQLHSAPIGWPTLVRNAVLAGLAALVILYPGTEGPGPWTSVARFAGSNPVQIGLIAFVAALALFQVVALYHLLAQNGRLMLRLEAIEARVGIRGEDAFKPGLPVGLEAPAFRLPGLSGGTVSLDLIDSSNRPLLLLFSDAKCGACDAILPDVARWQRQHADKLTVVVVTRGDRDANAVKADTFGIQHVLLQTDREVAEAYRIEATPAAVLIRDGVVAAHQATGMNDINALVRKTTMPSPAKKGQRVPSLELNDLDGRLVDLASLGGTQTLLLFWNPACGFCQAMLEDLKAWEKDKPAGAPELVVISRGSRKENREQGFRGTVLLDRGFSAGLIFGASGTPAAVTIDARGRVISNVRIGSADVLDLVKARPEFATL